MYCDKRPLIINVSPRHPSTPPPTNAAASTTADVWSRRRLTGALCGDNRSSAGQSSLLPFNIALLGDRLRDRTDEPFALIVASHAVSPSRGVREQADFGPDLCQILAIRHFSQKSCATLAINRNFGQVCARPTRFGQACLFGSPAQVARKATDHGPAPSRHIHKAR